MALNRPHLFLPTEGIRLNFSTIGGGGNRNPPPAVANRAGNARRILDEIAEVIEAAEALDAPEIEATRIPMTVRATTKWGVADTLPGRRNEVLSVAGVNRDSRLNVALDPSTLNSFRNAAKKYHEWAPEAGRKPNNFNFFEAKPEISLTSVEDLWVSHVPLPEADEEIRWEVWLQPSAEPRFREVLALLDLRAQRAVQFEDIRILALNATREQFERLARSAAISQLRPASGLNSTIMQVPAGVQEAAVTAAAERIIPADAGAPAVCLLDTGIYSDHPLLTQSIGTVGSVVAGEGDDWDGHGTKMAGIALFDNLSEALAARSNIRLAIGLESVAIEGPLGASGTRLPAERLRRAVDVIEGVQDRPRTFCFAMNAPDDANDGSASSLSSELDLLAADVAHQRLFCVAAGNLEEALQFGDYQALNDSSAMLSPSQAWNVLSVGACTDLVGVPDTHEPVAPEGDLCPWSRTSTQWTRQLRPAAKPDVVFEGGNQMVDTVSQDLGIHRDLCVLTTSADAGAPLALTGQTSAATAAVAGLCANLQSEYPALWPETIRGLVVHSSEYTPAMNARADLVAPQRGSRQQALIERFGYGRPDRFRAMENAEDSLTLINQAWLRPLRPNDAGNAAILGQMRVHQLPWPTEVLEDLGPEVETELRVTLSYFIEPNPGVVIVKGEVDQYPSHGFDFDIQRPDESEDQAIARINSLHRVAIPSIAGTPSWAFGQLRGRGSVRHDRLRLPASDLARVAGVLVFPRKGWWGRNLDRIEQQARYSLIVSIRTPGEEIYTEIATAIDI